MHNVAGECTHVHACSVGMSFDSNMHELSVDETFWYFKVQTQQHRVCIIQDAPCVQARAGREHGITLVCVAWP